MSWPRAARVTASAAITAACSVTSRPWRYSPTTHWWSSSVPATTSGVDPQALAAKARDAFALARRMAPNARLLVIGPPWPTADVPGVVLQIRDVLNAQARSAGATFVDPLTARWFFDTPNLIGTDGVHPTDLGHAYLAQLDRSADRRAATRRTSNA